MPTDDKMMIVIQKLLEGIAHDDQLRKSINDLKIKPYPEELLEIVRTLNPSPENDFPKIVLYVTGKESAQYAIKALRKLLHNIPGLNRAPAFNQKVTDLIYVTQGDRSDKINYPEFYKGPATIYFDAQKINEAEHISIFKQQDFELDLD